MPRKPAPEVSKPEAIRPVASPSDTYVRPAEPAPSDLHQLAQGLSAADTGLSDFLAKRQEEADAVDKIRGEAAFNRSNALGWGEAVRQGLVPANASPVYMRSYKAAQGELAGVQLQDKFTKEYLQWEGRAANDPNAFSQFLTDFVSRNVQTDDIDVLRGLNPHIETLKQEAFKAFTKDSGQSVYNGSLDTRAAIINRQMQAANDDGLSQRTGTDYEGLWSNIMANRAEAIASGIRPEDIDAQIVTSIGAKAVEYRDPGLLKLLDKSTDGSKIALKDYPNFAEVRRKTIEKLETEGRQEEADATKRQARADKVAEDAATTEILRSLSQDPRKPIPEEQIRQLEKFNPRTRTLIAESRRSLTSELETEDPREILLLERDVAEGASREDILQAAANGKIKSAATMASLLDRQAKYAKARADGSGILTNASVRRYVAVIKERTADSTAPTDDEMKDPEVLVKHVLGEIFGTNLTMSDEGLHAISTYEMMLLDWEERHPGANALEREAAINSLGQTALSSLPIKKKKK